MKHRDAKRLATAVSALNAVAKERDPLAQLELARRAREAAEQLEQTFVDLARVDGRTWTEIGDLYGLTKQGAQQRFREDRARRRSKRL